MGEFQNNMLFGIINLNTVPPWKTEAEEIRDELEQIKVADELGFHSAWVAEHNASHYGVISSAAVNLAAVADQTKQIKLGTAVVRLPFYNPIKLAEELAFVDVISNGRLYVGVGKGYDKNEFLAYDIDFTQKDERFLEILDVLKSALRSEKFSYSGEYFNFNNVSTYPRPVQEGGPPIYVMVSQSDSSIINAAKHGYSFILGNQHRLDYEQARRKVALYRETALASGFTEEYVHEVIARSGQQLDLYVAESMEQAIEEYKNGYEYYYNLRNERNIAGDTFRKEIYDHHYFATTKKVIIGPPEKVIRDIEEFRKETGLNHIICWFNTGGQPQQTVLKSMRLFAKEVMPHFNSSK